MERMCNISGMFQGRFLLSIFTTGVLSQEDKISEYLMPVFDVLPNITSKPHFQFILQLQEKAVEISLWPFLALFLRYKQTLGGAYQ